MLQNFRRFISRNGEYSKHDSHASSEKNLFNQLPVGFRHLFRVNRGKIDLRGLQAFVPQALADNSQICPHVAYGAGPRVARYILNSSKSERKYR